MDIAVDRASPVPLYLQISRRIRDLILSGMLPEGHRLPPERSLANALGVNRSTVLNAYRELKADALVGAHVGQGTTVLPQTPGASADRSDSGRVPWRQLFREGKSPPQDPLVRDLLELSEHEDVITLSIGMPAPDSLPLGVFQQINNELLREIGPALLLHSPTEGLTSLRETLATLMTARGVRCSASEVLVLSGSQQGLDVAARVFLEPGDAVVVEEPSYFGALQAFRAAQARLVGIPTDENGLRTDVLAGVLERLRPKLIYTLPTFQNPSGIVMSLERRRELLELSHRHQVPILEDDPYFELRYDGEEIPSLRALDTGGSVLHLTTASKVLFPGLRLGWLIAPRPVVRQAALVKQTLDLHSNSAGQWILDRFICAGHYEPHLKRVRRLYARRRRDAMDAALRRDAPEGLAWRRPAGGFYIWCRLPDNVERSRLITRAADAGVSFLPGWSCYVDPPRESFVRLNFTYPPADQIPEGVARFLATIREISARARSAVRKEGGTPPIV